MLLEVDLMPKEIKLSILLCLLLNRGAQKIIYNFMGQWMDKVFISTKLENLFQLNLLNIVYMHFQVETNIELMTLMKCAFVNFFGLHNY